MKKSVSAFTFLCLVFILFCVGCGLEKQEEKCIFVLFDISGSTLVSREQFYKDFQKVFNEMKKGRLIVDLISENPLAQSVFPINETIQYSNFKRMFYDGGTEKYDEDFNQQKNKILNEAKKLIFESKPRKKTKILDSVRLAKRVFTTYKEGKKELIFFSDMVEESDDYNFTTMELSDKKINQIIEKEKKREESGLPNLNGVQVYVVGATHSIYGGMSTDRILAIEKFWRTYFKECGANLVSYGSCLLGYDE